jgi:hypothetical protein
MGGQRLGAATGRSNASQRFSVAQQSIDPVAANPPGMNSVLVVHLVLGIVVALCAVLFVWVRIGRRITLYALTLQILLGIGLIIGGLRAPSPHYALAVLAWAGYMYANALGKKEGQGKNVMVVTILSSVMVVLAAYIGSKAAGLG